MSADVDLGIAGLGPATEVGRGGFGVVYRAPQDEFNRSVAVKVLAVQGLATSQRERFTREIRAGGPLSGHPNIVPVLGLRLHNRKQILMLHDYVGEASRATLAPAVQGLRCEDHGRNQSNHVWGVGLVMAKTVGTAGAFAGAVRASRLGFQLSTPTGG